MQFMPNPEDLAPTLPLGVYVEFEYRCKLDDLAHLMLGISGTPHHGIAELQFALANVLDTSLKDAERFASMKLIRASQ